MKRSFLLVLLVGIAAWPSGARGQALPFTHYTPESEINPLPSAEVHQVFQDRLGYLWMAVFSSGLVRYDGARMDLYGTADGLRDVAVWEAVEDPAGRLWVGSSGGLVVSERPLGAYGVGQRPRFTASFGGAPLLDASVTHGRMAVAADGWLWVGTDGRGIVRYRVRGAPAADTLRTAPGGAGPDVPVRALAARRDGSVWVALLGGDLLVFSPGARAPRRVAFAEAGSDVSTNALYEDAGGVLWGGRQNGEVWRLREGAGGSAFETVSRALTSAVSGFAAGAGGVLWVTSEGAGLLRLDRSGAGRVYTRANGLLSEISFHATEDREGNVWVAQSGGVSKLRFNAAAFENYTARSFAGERPALPSPSVNAVLLGRGGGDPCALWAGTSEGGLACVGPGGTASPALGEADGLQSNWVNGLAFDDRGRLWIGTVRGLSVLTFGPPLPPVVDPARSVRVAGRPARLAAHISESVLAVTALPLPAGPRSPAARSVWFPAYQALYALVGDEWFKLGPEAGLPLAVFHAVAVDAAGRLWVGTRDNGLYRSTGPVTLAALRGAVAGRGPRFTRVWSVENGAPTNQIEALRWFDGTMWVGTNAGLAALDGASGVARALLTPASGLPAGNATSLAVSPTTRTLWVGTNGGLAEVDPVRRRVLRTVTKADGLVDNEVWFFGSVVAGPDGAVYFGTAKGVSVYRPWLDRPNWMPPLLRLTRASFTEDAGQNEAAFEYAALSFADERGVRYRTRLAGYDAVWSPARADVKLRYTNLPAVFFPKTYALEVQASNGDGVWTPVPLTHTFRVSPRWSLRWWAFALYALALVGAGLVVYRVQHRRLVRRLVQRTHEREQALRIEAAEARAEVLNADNARKTEELENARRLQLSMLPKTLPAHPAVDLAAHMHTATEVGGDYYDFHVAADGTLTFAIGDATGHGAAAGTMVTATKSLFVILAEEPSLQRVLERSTVAIRRMGLPRLFMALALLRLRGRTLELVGAGMPPAMLYRAATGEVGEVPLKGFPLGAPPGYPYRPVTLELEPGDVLLLMSDGFPELFSPDREMLGYEAIGDLFAAVAERSPDEIIAHMMETAARWTGKTASADGTPYGALNGDGAPNGRPPAAHEGYEDDITFIALKVKA